MFFRARRAGACLLLVAIPASAFSLAANSTSASMQVSVTVVRSCSVSSPATSGASSVNVTLECRKGAADVVSVGVTGTTPASVQRVLPGPNQISIAPAARPLNTQTDPLIVTIEF